MDEEYNLSPGEVLIMQGDHVELVSGKERIRLNEVVLTNKNLILVNEVSAGIFTTQRLLKRCPLDDIICSESIPQAFLGKKKDMYVLLGCGKAVSSQEGGVVCGTIDVHARNAQIDEVGAVGRDDDVAGT